MIVPTLNEENYIEGTFLSLRKQAFKNYELILSDGNSEDETIRIARNYADKIIISDERGIAIQQNNGAKIASGKFLVFSEPIR